MTAPPERLEAFIARWQGREGGQERANYGLFLSELCDVPGVRRPDPAAATNEENDYVFERRVMGKATDGSSGARPHRPLQARLLRSGGEAVAPGRRQERPPGPVPVRSDVTGKVRLRGDSDSIQHGGRPRATGGHGETGPLTARAPPRKHIHLIRNAHRVSSKNLRGPPWLSRVLRGK